ncbi:MAG TPA: methyltransferase [Lachnospiraceae bacterium]|nr:methyltransferase [Lachnospiraceae bacterium]
MTSRERVIEAINHRVPDRVPVDLGGTQVSTISAKAYQNLRAALGLPEKPCELNELFMFAAKVDDDVREKLGIDTVCLNYPVDTNGCRTNRLQPFTSLDGAHALIAADNKWDILKDGSIVMYPQGDKTVPASTKMLPGGSFFDNIMERLPEYDEDNLTPREDFKDDFPQIRDDVAKEIENNSVHLDRDTDYAVIGQFPYALLGDAGVVPAPFVKHPAGIRKMADFLAATLMYPEYVEEVFTMQTENTMKNLEIYREAVGDRIQVILVSTADYGAQNSALISTEVFQELYKPHYTRINNWIHTHTNWKTMYHCCGSIVNFMDDFVDMGVDILNPVQLSAKDMDGKMLKEKYGSKICFWGGGVDSQKTLAFSDPDGVRKEVRERMDMLSDGGGYVFNPVHNIVSDTKVENILAMFDAVREYNSKF